MEDKKEPTEKEKEIAEALRKEANWGLMTAPIGFAFIIGVVLLVVILKCTFG